MADESLVLTTMDVDTLQGVASMKGFAKQAETTSQSVRTSMNKMDDGLGPLRDILEKSRAQTAALDTQIARVGATSQAASVEAVAGFGAIGAALGVVGVAAGATALVVGGTVAALNAFAEAAAPVTQVTRAFENLTAETGESSDAFLSKLRPATQGLVSDMELMRATNKALQQEIPLTSQQFADLASGAVKLGQGVGVGALQSINQLTEGIARQSPAMLAHLGVIVRAQDAYQAYADRLGLNVNALDDYDRHLAFTEAAIEAVRKKTAATSDELPAFSEQWQQASVSIDNVKTSTLGYLDQVGGKAIVSLGEWLFGTKQVTDATGELGQGIAALGPFSKAASDEFLGNRRAEQSVMRDLFVQIAAGTVTTAAGFGDLGASIIQAMQNALGPMADVEKQLQRIHEEALAAGKTSPDNAIEQEGLRIAAAGMRPVERAEGFQEQLDKNIQKLDDLQASAVFLRGKLAETFDPKQVGMLRTELIAVDRQIDAMTGNLRDRQAQFAQQLLQAMVGSVAKGSEIQAALQQAAIASRFNREIEGARKQGESTIALEQARDVAVSTSRQQSDAARTRRAFADDETIARAHLQNDQLTWEERIRLEERAVSDRFEIAVNEADLEGRSTAAIFEAYQTAIDGINRKHTDSRRLQAIANEQSLNEALFDLAQARTENKLQALSPETPQLFGGDATQSVDREQDLARERLQVMQAALADEAIMRFDSIQAEYDREIVLAGVNNDQLELAERNRNASLLKMRTELATKSTQLIRDSQQAQAQIYQANFNIQMAGIQAVAGAVGSAVQSIFGKTKSGAKAAAIVNAAAAVVAALAQIPYPYNFVVAAITTAAAQLQISKINSASIGGGGDASSAGSPGPTDFSAAVNTPTAPGQQPNTGTTPVIANAAPPPPQATTPVVAQAPAASQTQAPRVQPPTQTVPVVTGIPTATQAPTIQADPARAVVAPPITLTAPTITVQSPRPLAATAIERSFAPPIVRRETEPTQTSSGPQRSEQSLTIESADFHFSFPNVKDVAGFKEWLRTREGQRSVSESIDTWRSRT